MRRRRGNCDGEAILSAERRAFRAATARGFGTARSSRLESRASVRVVSGRGLAARRAEWRSERRHEREHSPLRSFVSHSVDLSSDE